MNTRISESSWFLEFSFNFMSTHTFFYWKQLSLEVSFHDKTWWVVLVEKDREGRGSRYEMDYWFSHRISGNCSAEEMADCLDGRHCRTFWSMVNAQTPCQTLQNFHRTFFFLSLFFIGRQWLYTAVLVSGVQQSESITYIPFSLYFLPRLCHLRALSSLCYIVSSYQLCVVYIILNIC